jgi:hypothetical protein
MSVRGVVAVGVVAVGFVAASLTSGGAAQANTASHRHEVDWTRSARGTFLQDLGLMTIDRRAGAIDVVSSPNPSQHRSARIVAISYTPSGHRRWVYREQESAGETTVPVAATLDARDHRLYVLATHQTGSSDTIATTLTAISDRGVLMWSRTITTSWSANDPGDQFAGPYGLAVDPAKHRLYAVGITTLGHAQTIAVNLAGRLQWARGYAPHDGCLAPSVTVDPSSHRVVTVASCTVIAGKNYVVSVYGPGGALKWRRDSVPPGYDYAVASAVVTDPRTGAVTISGLAASTNTSAGQWYTVAYGRNGGLKWARLMPRAGTATALALDAATGGVDISGEVLTSHRNTFEVQSIGPRGRLRWRYKEPLCGECGALRTEVAADPRTGRVVASDNPTAGESFVVQLSARGSQLKRTEFSDIFGPTAVGVLPGRRSAIASGVTDLGLTTASYPN